MNHGIDSQNKKLYLQLKKIRDLACIFLGENPKLREKKNQRNGWDHMGLMQLWKSLPEDPRPCHWVGVQGLSVQCSS